MLSRHLTLKLLPSCSQGVWMPVADGQMAPCTMISVWMGENLPLKFKGIVLLWCTDLVQRVLTFHLFQWRYLILVSSKLFSHYCVENVNPSTLMFSQKNKSVPTGNNSVLLSRFNSSYPRNIWTPRKNISFFKWTYSTPWAYKKRQQRILSMQSVSMLPRHSRVNLRWALRCGVTKVAFDQISKPLSASMVGCPLSCGES